MKRLVAQSLALFLWATLGFAEGLDEATIQPDTRSGIERLVSRAGFGDIQKSYALIVGVSDFAEYADLPTGSDPQRVYDYLIEEAGFDYVHILTEEKVTKARLEELMVDELRPLIGSSDRFLFYWSGHGETLELGNGEMGFLPIADSRKSTFSTMVAMSDLSRWNRYIAAHQVLYLLDSCFSGLAGAAPQSDLAEITREQLSGQGRHMITAGRANEQTIAIDDLGGSIFTHALLKGLRGAADSNNALGADGLIAVGELKNYLGQEIGRLRRVYDWQKTITPQIRDLSGSDGAFFFPLPASFPVTTDVSPGTGEVTPQGGENELVEVQQGLIELGYDPGPADGVLGFATRRALIAFQTDNGLERTGAPDDLTVLALIKALVPGQSTPPDNEVQTREGDLQTDVFEVPLTDVGDVDEGMTADAQKRLDPIVVPGAGPSNMSMATILGGAFTMGRDDGRPEQGPSHMVSVAPFRVATTETTMGLFRSYIEAEGLDFVSRKVEPDPTCYAWSADNRLRRTAYAYNQLSKTPPDHPVSCVNLDDISEFLNWLNQEVEGPLYRLLSEAEFEFLLDKDSRPFDDYSRRVSVQPALVCANANIADAGSQFDWRNTFCEDGALGVTRVARYEPGAFDLYDIRGNLWEWVSDCWRPTHNAPQPNGECETGTVRGASFDDPLDNLHPSVRQPVPVKRRQTNIGFRLARDAP